MWQHHTSITCSRPSSDGSQYGTRIRTSGASAYRSQFSTTYWSTKQLENARAALDLYRSAERAWESAIDFGSWPCALPPVGYAEYFL